jgi:hypothetical protein
MKTINHAQVEQLLKDIQSIKSVINKNRPVLQQIMDLRHFRLLMLLFGISVIGFSLLVFFLSAGFGSFNSIPPVLRYALYLVMAGDAVFLQIFKQRTYLKAIKEIDPRLTLGWWLKELFSHRIMHLYIPISILIAVFSIYFSLRGIPYFIIPMLSMAMGLLLNMGALIHIKHSLISGYWFLLTGILTMIFPVIPGPIALCITIGCGSLLVSGIAFLGPHTTRGE